MVTSLGSIVSSKKNNDVGAVPRICISEVLPPSSAPPIVNSCHRHQLARLDASGSSGEASSFRGGGDGLQVGLFSNITRALQCHPCLPH